MKRLNIRTEPDRGTNNPSKQAQNGSTSPDSSKGNSQQEDKISEMSQAQLASIAIAQLTNPRALPVFREWLCGVPAGVLQNLVGTLPVELRTAPTERSIKLNQENELWGAIQQAHALNTLLENTLLFPSDGGEYNDEIKCGLVELSEGTFTRLSRASRAVCA
jgi:hypothetical protein